MGAPLLACLTQLVQRVAPGEAPAQDDHGADPGSGPDGPGRGDGPGRDDPPPIFSPGASGGRASLRDSGFSSFQPVDEVVPLGPLLPLPSPPVLQPGRASVAGTGGLTAAVLPGGPPSAPPGASGVSGG